jgi:cytochrome b6-f complex iron-sulfur subunit
MVPNNFPDERRPDAGRRRFMLLLPFGVLAGIAGTMVTAAFRFLRPLSGSTTAAARWVDIGPLSKLKGDKPLLKRLITEQQTGWATSREEHFVYVLPGKDNTVLSCVCPHEGCNVSWSEGQDGFICPCHDSFFAADGSRVKGPARRGLDPLPTREQNGVLQVQYVSFVNNTEQREVLE